MERGELLHLLERVDDAVSFTVDRTDAFAQVLIREMYRSGVDRLFIRRRKPDYCAADIGSDCAILDLCARNPQLPQADRHLSAFCRSRVFYQCRGARKCCAAASVRRRFAAVVHYKIVLCGPHLGLKLDRSTLDRASGLPSPVTASFAISGAKEKHPAPNADPTMYSLLPVCLVIYAEYLRRHAGWRRQNSKYPVSHVDYRLCDDGVYRCSIPPPLGEEKIPLFPAGASDDMVHRQKSAVVLVRRLACGGVSHGEAHTSIRI